MKRLIISFLLGALLALIPGVSLAETFEVTIGDFFFTSSTVTVSQGDTVKWTNRGSSIHNIRSGQNCIPDGRWGSSDLSPGDSFSMKFDEIGTFPYLCNIAQHCAIFGMAGKIVVEADNDGELENPIPGKIQRGDLSIRLEIVATGLTAPNWGTFAPGHPDHLFVTDQDGILWTINLITGKKRIFLDVGNRLVELGISGPGTFDERGLLGVAFHPDYVTNGLLYTYESQPVGGPADFSTMPSGVAANHQSVITEWHVSDPTDPNSVVDPNSAQGLLRINQPQFNHNGGALNFGPDNMLYISLGDGGGADDVDGQVFLGTDMVGHGNGNGQNPGNILGTILRIDPFGSNSANGNYGIPNNNPFIGRTGFVEEIFAYGFRNPFRFSFDTVNGNLYVGDVGQNKIEEVNRVTSGGNYGWNLKEGKFCFDPNNGDAGFVFKCNPEPAGLKNPIAQYDHDEGIAVIGGFVYRGRGISALRGRYIFGDLSKTGGDGRLFYLTKKNDVVEFKLPGRINLNLWLLGFGRDARGEIYVLGNTTGVPFKTTGVVLKIIP